MSSGRLEFSQPSLEYSEMHAHLEERSPKLLLG